MARRDDVMSAVDGGRQPKGFKVRAVQRAFGVLADTLEPPDAAHVLRSFASLYELDLFDSPRDEEARLTSMGSFVLWRMSHSRYSLACFLSRSRPARIATWPTYSMIAPEAAASFLRVLPRLPSAYEYSSPRKGNVS